MASSSFRETEQERGRLSRIVREQSFLAIVFLALAAFGMLSAYFMFNQVEETPVNAYAVIAPVETNSDVVFGLSSYRERWVRPDGQPLRIGIISGHKASDAGAVCESGLTEADVNLNIAQQVVTRLEIHGVETELLDEFDPRLDGYSADALISIHADSCNDYGDSLTGFKLAASNTRASLTLKNCVYQTYATRTQLLYHVNTITPHMTDYHAFREIAADTPALIIETGFMNRDLELLTERSEVSAEGIELGILCFLEQMQ